VTGGIKQSIIVPLADGYRMQRIAGEVTETTIARLLRTKMDIIICNFDSRI
jgi:hypothetical protein